MATGGDGAADLQGWLRRELSGYVLALRQLAYSVPNGIGERDLLRLSERLSDLAGRGLDEQFAALASGPEPAGGPGPSPITEIRAVIPAWPETDGTPWQLCPSCHIVYDPTVGPHDHRPRREPRGGAGPEDVIAQARDAVMDSVAPGEQLREADPMC